MVSGAGLFGAGAEWAGPIAAETGCRLVAPFFAPRVSMGEGAVAFESMTYGTEFSVAFLDGLQHIVVVGDDRPVNFFAYPRKPSTPEPPGCSVDLLCFGDWDVLWTLSALAEATGARAQTPVHRTKRVIPEVQTGTLTADGIGRGLARALAEGAIVVNEAVTAGRGILPHLSAAAAHDRINNTGGSIGQCLPNAIGAAVACPHRPVFAISGDGSAMYQIQALWNAARERRNITVVIIANRGYQILHMELEDQGAPRAGRNARAMFDIEDPLLDWVALAAGHGVPGRRVDTEEAFEDALAQAASTAGPFLIEAAI